LRRCRTIAEALSERFPELSVLILSGSPIIGSFDFPERVDFVRLPGVIKLSNGDYTARSPGRGLNETIALRGAIINQVADSFAPDLLIVDKEPLGLRGEMAKTLELLKGRGTRLVLGLRDILDDPVTLAREWDRKNAIPALEQFYDEIWVYGCEQIYDPLDGLDLPRRAREITKFTGYLRRHLPNFATPAPWPRLTERPFNLITTGGGGDGDAVIDWALTAYESSTPPREPGLFVLGPFMETTKQIGFTSRVAKLGRDRVAAIIFDPHFEQIEARAIGIIAMGGYNTFCEMLSLEKPTVIVPRTAPRREQLIRAERAQELALSRMLRDPAEQAGARTPEAMTSAIDALAGQPPPRVGSVPHLLDGLDVICERTAELLERQPTTLRAKQSRQ
jgi:predicted glycosyltransferase